MDRGLLNYYILLVCGMMFWGGSWVSAKIVVAIAPPYTVGFFRFFIASLFFLPILLATQWNNLKTLTRRDIGIWCLLGTIGVFGYGILFLIGMQFTTSTQGSIIAGVNPTLVSLLAFAFLKERLSARWQYSGYLFSFLGIVFVVGIQTLFEFQLEYLIGNLILLCAMLTWGTYSILGKVTMRNRSSIETTAGGIFFGTILFFIGALSEQFWTLPAIWDITFWLNVIYMGILVTVAGFLFYFMGLKNLGASHAAVFISLVPVFGTLFSILFLNEPLYPTFLVGLILVVIGILIINYPRKRLTPSSSDPSEAK